MKTRKIKYFQGYKKLNKNVKMFEEFSIDEDKKTVINKGDKVIENPEMEGFGNKGKVGTVIKKNDEKDFTSYLVKFPGVTEPQEYHDGEIVLDTKIIETTIELTPNGEDDWSRVLYKGSDGKTYVDVDGTPHSVTSEGEPIAPIKDYKITGDGNKPVNEGKVDKVEEFLEEFVEKHIQGKYGFPDELVWNAGSGGKLGTYTLDHEGNESAWTEVFIERSAFEKLDFKELDRVLRDAAEGKYWDTSILSNDDDDPCSVSFSIEFGNNRFRR